MEGEKFKRKIKLCAKKRTVTVAGIYKGELVFRLKMRNGSVKKCVFRGDDSIVDGKLYQFTEEQLGRFDTAGREFYADLAAARAGDGFMRVEKDGQIRYYRRRRGFVYQIIGEDQTGNVWQYFGLIPNFLFDIMNMPRFFDSAKRPDYTLHMREANLMLLCGDRYAVCAVKYYYGRASVEETRYLMDADKVRRYLQCKEQYGPDDIKIINSRRVPRVPFYPHVRYFMTVELDGVQYSAIYLFDKGELEVMDGEKQYFNVPLAPGYHEYFCSITKNGQENIAQ